MAKGASPKNGRFAHRAAALVLVTIAIAASVSACLPEGRYCSPGDFRPCTTSSGAAGAAMCNDDGTDYGDCDSSLLLDGSIPPALDASTDASSGEAGACSGTTNLGLTCPCTDNTSCASNFCYTYPSKGPHCTNHCTTDNDCPPPALGCNPQGICKVP